MIVGIDASNLHTGGSLTHLRGVLEALDPDEHDIARVLVWSGARTLDRLPTRRWLEPIHEPLLDRSLPLRLFWQSAVLPRRVVRTCDVLFVPGGLVFTSTRPVVTMCRNMLPFDPPELRRYAGSVAGFRLQFLRWGQAQSFRRAQGVIFLTEFARKAVTSQVDGVAEKATVIPHGVDERFRRSPSYEKTNDETNGRPFRALYVSTIDRYKHQGRVVEAVSSLRKDGVAITLELVGSAQGAAARRLDRTVARIDPGGAFVHRAGAVPFEQLPRHYCNADIFVFASSCENMPNILVEAMASGLPIASSSRGPMPEILGDSALFFDPERPDEIAAAIRRFAVDPGLRRRYALAAFERARRYTWANCARRTFAFLAATGRLRGGDQRRSSESMKASTETDVEKRSSAS